MRTNQRTGESVLHRAFKILDVLESAGTQLGLSEIALRANMPKATTYRLLNQLAELGAVERKGEWYLLGSHLFTLGAAVAAQRRLREAALPHMANLCDSLRQVVHLGVLDAGSVLHIEKTVPRLHKSARDSLGSRRPVHATAMGKAILAFVPPVDLPRHLQPELKRYTPYTVTSMDVLKRQLATVQQCGFAVEHEEWVLGFNCVAAPVFDASGLPIAGLSVAGATNSFRAESGASALCAAASRISRALSSGSSISLGG
ncbi:IclR family transcriptional regulator [Streptomyces sp. NBC_00988]|uniref:IclR family transcriptional regulator n=1 Tax=Streptomyces sp. NBC_00988 TaxID=2903704 RepID=UPI00386E2B4A|nr:IclR family transcriptional regulator [Streptomyces sp. NBC_00988]